MNKPDTNALHKLSDCTESGDYQVIDVKGIFADRLYELGILPGSLLSYVRPAPFGFPVEIKVRGQLLALRKSECDCILLLPAE